MTAAKYSQSPTECFRPRRFAPDEPVGPVEQEMIEYLINTKRTQQGRMAVVSILSNMKANGEIYGTFTLPDPSEV